MPSGSTTRICSGKMWSSGCPWWRRTARRVADHGGGGRRDVSRITAEADGATCRGSRWLRMRHRLDRADRRRPPQRDPTCRIRRRQFNQPHRRVCVRCAQQRQPVSVEATDMASSPLLLNWRKVFSADSSALPHDGVFRPYDHPTRIAQTRRRSARPQQRLLVVGGDEKCAIVRVCQ